MTEQDLLPRGDIRMAVGQLHRRPKHAKNSPVWRLRTLPRELMAFTLASAVCRQGGSVVTSWIRGLSVDQSGLQKPGSQDQPRT
jgi:hypothetical protein